MTTGELLIAIWITLYARKSFRELRRFVPGSKGEPGWSKELSLSIIAIWKLFIPNYLFRDLRKHPQRRRHQRREANLRVQSVWWWTNNFHSIVITTQPTETSPTIAYNYTQTHQNLTIKCISTKNITQQTIQRYEHQITSTRSNYRKLQNSKSVYWISSSIRLNMKWDVKFIGYVDLCH